MDSNPQPAQPVPIPGDVLPPAIDGLDLALLRMRLGGLDTVIVTILRQFQRDFEAWPDQFDAAQAAQDNYAMTRLAHSLKGTAANIAASPVQGAALALETALREGRGPQPALVQACRQSLQQLLQGLRLSLPAPQVTMPAAQSSPQALIVQLRELLQRRRIVPEALQQQLRSALAPRVAPQQLDALLAQLARFDYAQAQQSLAAIEQEISS